MSADSQVISASQTISLAAAVPRPLVIAVAGNPNAGKTSLFNALTGLKQKVANYPGVTVESKTGSWSLARNLPAAQLIDLPGLYSLEATSLDEEIARDVLLGRTTAVTQPDVVIVVVDATNLARNLYLATQLIDTGRPLVIALTMFDLAERNRLGINVKQLEQSLGVSVVPVVAKQRRGIDALGIAVLEVAHRGRRWNTTLSTSGLVDDERRREILIQRYQRIEQVIAGAVKLAERGHLPNLTERIDRVATHRIAGPLVLLLIMLLVFQSIFSWASLPMDLIDHGFSALGSIVRSTLPAGIFTDLLVDGVVAGVGGVLVFLPQIFLLFLFISLLEDSGYMARAAFLMDRLMRMFGLHGKAFVPLLSSFACAVPGIMATRTIENPKDRLTTILIAPFMSCSARLPVYTLMIATFFSGQKILGVLSVGVVIILGMYLLGLAVAVTVAWVLKHTILSGPSAPFVMELPPYRVPSFANVAHNIGGRVGLFIKRAGTVILAISILLWALAAFPRSPNQQSSDPAAAANSGQQIRNSYAGRLGHVIEPLIAPLGFDWRIGIGLISSFAARETVISTLSIVYNIGDDSKSAPPTLVEGLRSAKRPDGSPVWTPLVGLSLMVFFVLACQCMSTLAIVRRETNSWRWPLFMVAYMLVLAYISSLITYQGGRFLGFS